MQKRGFAALAIILIILGILIVGGGIWYYEAHKLPPQSTPVTTAQPSNSFYYIKETGISASGTTEWSIMKSNADGSQKETLFTNNDNTNQEIFIADKQLLIAGSVDSVSPEVDVFDLANGKKTVLYKDGIISTSTDAGGDVITCTGVITGFSATPDGSMITILRQADYAETCGQPETLITFSWNGSGYAETNQTSSTSTDLSAFISQLFSTDRSHGITISGSGKEGAPGIGTLSIVNLSNGSSTSPLSGNESVVTSNIISNTQQAVGYFAVNDAVAFNLECGMGGPLDGRTIKAINFSTLSVNTLYTATSSLVGYRPLLLSNDGRSLLVQETDYLASTTNNGYQDETSCLVAPNTSTFFAINTATGVATPVANVNNWGEEYSTLIWENTVSSSSFSFVINGTVVDTSSFANSGSFNGNNLSDYTGRSGPYIYLGSAQ